MSKYVNIYLCLVFIIIVWNDRILAELEDPNLEGFCQKNDNREECKSPVLKNKYDDVKYIQYDVNPSEGFNLRRDVYMRMAVFVNNLKSDKKYKNVKLVLPPWSNLYHWRSKNIGGQNNLPWSLFFNLKSLKSFAPVVEFNEIFSDDAPILIDRIFMLKHLTEAFKSGNFDDKWKIEDRSACQYTGDYFGHDDLISVNIDCVAFLGRASKLQELLDLHSNEKTFMFTNAEIALHDEYGTAMFWEARKSMVFNKELIDIAGKFVEDSLKCVKERCDNYVAVHWRRTDFSKRSYKDVPSIQGTAEQIFNIINKEYKSLIKTVFIATDAPENEYRELKNLLNFKQLNVEKFVPSVDVKKKFKDGGVAIIDQIICSRGVYFIGTHESTFTFRIQEEREILGFKSSTTFNRLCPDSGHCDSPSKWRIVH